MAIWYFLGLVAGMAQAVQGAVNAQLRAALESPLWAATISFIVGTLGLVALVLATRAPIPTHWPSRAWVWSGGLLGVFYVGSAILLVPRIGAATMIGVFVAGQMCAAMALDHYGWIGLPQHTATLPRLLGASLIVLGVFVLRRF